MRINILVVLFLLTGQMVFAQWCGTPQSELIKERLLNNKESLKNGNPSRILADIYVPIKFHLVGKSAGTGHIEEYLVYDELCNLNQAYEEFGIQFYIKDGFNYVDNNGIYDMPASSSPSITMSAIKADKGKKALNIFVTNSADTGSAGTTLGYYNPFYDLIVIRKSQMGRGNGTVPHEVGHFFSMMHTFNGWDGEPYNQSTHGNPLNSAYSPNNVLNELQDRSNCETGGDFICDTKVDYNFGFGWSGCDEYTPEIKDFNGDIIDVEETNFMGYFIGCEEYFFSPTQQQLIIEDYNSTERNYLRSTVIPEGEAVIGEMTYDFPENNTDLDYYNNIHFEWSDITNADFYFLELKRGGSSESIIYKTEFSGIKVEDLEPGFPYTWRVYAVSVFPGCVIEGPRYSFTPGSLVANKETTDLGIDVYPTFVDSNNQLLLDSGKNQTVHLSLINIAGQHIQIGDKTLRAGTNALEIPTNVTSGVNFLKIESEKGVQTVKIVIQ